MTYCVTPGCLTAQNPDSARFCLSCGAKLWLQERYRPIKLIGCGGFGKTFLAVDEGIPCKARCVVKQFCFQGSSSQASKKAAELFHQEAVRLDELGKHSQIPTLIAHFEENKQLYLVQELITGQTLKQELQQNGVFDESQIWALLQGLLPVLQYIHSHRVIHRDIKPENIIRRTLSLAAQPNNLSSHSIPPGKGKDLVLIDFGVAKLLSDTRLVQTGTIIGTPEYMAPEQLKGKAFPASDLYSLGVTCIYLQTEVPPWDMYDSLHDCWVWRDFLPPDRKVSDRLGRILDKLLQNSLAQRFQSAQEVVRSLNPTSPPTQLVVSSPARKHIGTEVGIDYSHLKDLLARKKWKEADEHTWALLCQAIGKLAGYYFKKSDIDNLPCEDLRTIDSLWVKYSNGRFGFSVQKHIYEDVGQDYPSFCDRVGWPLHNPPNLDSMLKFNLRAPLGHLPSRRWIGGYSWWRHVSVLAQKLEQCGIT